MDEEDERFTFEHLHILAYRTTEFLERRWFGGMFEGEDQISVARLLIQAFSYYERGLLLTKTQARTGMRAVDARTARRYIELVEQQGLLTVNQSSIDQRVQYLCLTEKGHQLVKKELVQIADLIVPVAEWMRTEVHEKIVPKPSPLWGGTDALDDRLKERSRARIPEYTEAIRLAPHNVAAYGGRAVAYLEIGEHEKAIADFTAAIQLEPSNPRPFEWRAFAHELAGAYDKAIDDYSEAIRLNPDRAWNYGNRGDLFMTIQDYERAAADFTAVLESEYVRYQPSYEYHLYTTRADAYKAAGRVKEAIADYEWALKRYPRSEEIKEKLAQLKV